MPEAAEKISITITPAMKKLMDRRVANGDFASASELVREALRVWQKADEEHRARIAAIKARIKASIDDPRPSVPAEEAFERLKALHESRNNSAS